MKTASLVIVASVLLLTVTWAQVVHQPSPASRGSSIPVASVLGPPQVTPMESRAGQSSLERCGTALAVFEDRNGDGTRDLLMGCPGNPMSPSNPAPNVKLLDGAPDGDGNASNDLATIHTVSRPGRRSFGSAIQVLPDMNGDGIPEFAVGAPLADSVTPFQSEAGALEIFSGLDCSPLLKSFNNQPLVDYGSVASDHYASDIAVLDPISTSGPWYIAVGAYGGATTPGSVYVYRITRDSGMGSSARFTGQKIRAYSGAAVGVSPGGRFGWRVVRPETRILGAFNLDNDAYTDLLVSAPFDGTPGSNNRVGRVIAMSGDHVTNAIPTSFYWTWGNAADDNFGYDLAALEDKNGDGIQDWIAGAPGVTDPANQKPGFIRVADGKTGLPINSMGPSNTSSEVSGDSAGDRFGFAVLGIADINDWKSPGAPSYCDIAVGAPQQSSAAGYVRVLSGEAFNGLGTLPFNSATFTLRSFAGVQLGENFGVALASYDAKCNYRPLAGFGTPSSSLPDLAVGSPAFNLERGKVSIFGLNPLHAGTFGRSDKLYDPNTDLSELLLESSVGPAFVAPVFTGDSQSDFKTVTSANQDIWLRARSRTGCFEGYPVSLLIGWYSEAAGCVLNPFSFWTSGVHVPHVSVPAPNNLAINILGFDPFTPSPIFFSPVIPCGGDVQLQILNLYPHMASNPLRVVVQPFVQHAPSIPSLVPFFGQPPHGNNACTAGPFLFNSLAPLPPGYTTSPSWIAGSAHEIRFHQ